MMNINVYTEALDANTNATLSLVKSFPDNILHYKKDSAWSLLEIMEHITVVDRVCMAIVSRPSESRAETKEILGDEKLRHMLVQGRENKINSPDILKPNGVLKDIASFEKVFTGQRTQLKEQLYSGEIVADNRLNKHPFLGEMTYVDWLYFMIRHTERHLGQMKEVAGIAGTE